MRNRLSSHLLLLLALVAIEIVGYTAVHRAALIRGYETSWIGGARDLLVYLPKSPSPLWADTSAGRARRRSRMFRIRESALRDAPPCSPQSRSPRARATEASVMKVDYALHRWL